MSASINDASNDAIQFIVKHGDLTRSAAYDAIKLLTGNGFAVTRADLTPPAADYVAGPDNAWLPIVADFREWGPWIAHDGGERPAHIRVSLDASGASDPAIYLTASGHGVGRNYSPQWDEVTWYRLPISHDYYQLAARPASPDTRVACWNPMTTAPRHKPIIIIDGWGEVYRCWWQRDSLDGSEYWQNDADSELEPIGWMELPSLRAIIGGQDRG